VAVSTALIGSALLGVGTQAIADKKRKKAQAAAAAQAKKDQEERDAQARKSQVFAETEGKGTGTLGQVRSGISSEIDDEEESEVRQGKSARSSSLQI